MKLGIDFFPSLCCLCFVASYHTTMCFANLQISSTSQQLDQCMQLGVQQGLQMKKHKERSSVLPELQRERCSAFPDCLWTNHLTKETSEEQSSCLGNYDSSYPNLTHALPNKPLPFQTSCCLVSCEPERLCL